MNIESIFIYLFVFIISIICIFLSEHLSKKIFINFGLTICGIFAICALAAVRDPSVGRDVKLYLLPNYNYIISSKIEFWKLFNYLPIDNEPFFAILIYIAAKLESFNFLCFIIEFLVAFPVVYVLKKERKYVSVTLGYTMFLFLFYNFSLSGMRASISMSFFLLASYLGYKKNFKYSYFYYLVAFLFHKSAIFIFMIVVIIYKIEKSKRKKVMTKGLVSILFVIFLFYHKLIGEFIPIIKVVNPRYAYYIALYLKEIPGIELSNIPITDIILKTLIVFFVYIILKHSKKFNYKEKLCFKLCLIGRYFVIFNSVFYESMRIAYFFDFFIIIFSSYLGKGGGKYSLKYFEKIVLVLLAFIYWLYFIMIIGGYGTNILKFSI